MTGMAGGALAFLIPGSAWPVAGSAASLPAAEKLLLPTPRPGRALPLVVVAASHLGSETTDLIVPYGVLKASEAAQVALVSTRPGRVPLHPALTVQADMSMDEFDRVHPEGADLVVVPAMHDPQDAALLSWLRRQGERGAAMASICDGAWVLANAGLLDGRQATTFWYSQADIAGKFPSTRWVKDRGWVVDGPVMSTSGVSAALPASLAIVEFLGGREAALRTAARLEVAAWDDRHSTAAFRLSWRSRWAFVANHAAFWRCERVGIPVEEGVNEIVLALHADAWARTGRARVVATHPQGRVASARGLWIETEASDGKEDVALEPHDSRTRLRLDEVLAAISSRYGPATGELVRLEMEYDTP